MGNSVDREKVNYTTMLYGSDWYRMAAYDQDDGDITWHVENCMNYIIMLSEDRIPSWRAPMTLVLVSADWSELELLMLYRELLEEAAHIGYTPDAGMMTRINKAFSPQWGRAPRAGA